MNKADDLPNFSAASTRIAVCSWSLRPQSPEHLLESLKKLNIACVQLALSPVVNEPARWGGVIDDLRAGGIWISSGMMAMAGEDYSTLESIARTGGVRPDSTWFDNRGHAEKIARLACSMGISLVTFHAGFIPEDHASPERAKVIDRLRTIADIFGDYNIGLGLETGQESAQTLQNALDDLERSNVGVNFDPANMILYGKGDPIQALRRLAVRVVQIHIKDALPSTTPGTWGREMPVGHGAVDWNAFFNVALDIHPPVQFVIEREARSPRDLDIIAARDLVADKLRASAAAGSSRRQDG